jgi:glutamate-ammonia-ligase adenylyltransferase
MKPQLEELKALCAEIPEALLREHLGRLPERYFELFGGGEVCAHLHALSELSPLRPVQLLVRPLEPEVVECTVLAFDYPGEFSLITGILSASGLNILSGDVFTYGRSSVQQRAPAGEGRTRRRRRPAVEPLARGRNIDHFTGRLPAELPLEIWDSGLRERLQQTVCLLEQGEERSLEAARQKVNELVAERLASGSVTPERVLYPVQIQVQRDAAEGPRLKVISQDTPFFLYALSTALALRSVFIDYIRIRTVADRIEDEFSFLDARGRKLTDARLLDEVKLSVLLTKQFTYFLGSAPDPYTALFRFGQLVQTVLELPEQGRWLELLSNPLMLRELARLLGASDFLWEDFIRLQYESLLPMLEPHLQGRSFASPPEGLREGLQRAIQAASTPAGKRQALNEFKDREIFLLELDHIVGPQGDFHSLSRGLTRLAEAVVGAAVQLAAEELAARYGLPKTVAGLETPLAVFGLGTLGGGDLGYASDIELLFVYADQGSTSGGEQISNAEFFELVVREAVGGIEAKKEGIFQVDLRLRPHGASGPVACSLDAFCRYYGAEGEAHPLERLAQVRLRAIAGDPGLGGQVERLRDEMLYSGRALDLESLREARRRQMDERTRRGELNAKLSPGALLDLEYTVMLLQLSSGASRPGLRTPFMREALERLRLAGILAPEEAEGLKGAYEFLRRLINGLRMLRGSARDLFLPDTGSDEYRHLARRMGYTPSGELSPAQALHLDFETHTAFVRAFVERRFGRESLPVAGPGNVADLILSEALPQGQREQILMRAGFRNPERAYTNLRRLAAGSREHRAEVARLAVLATDLLRRQPDADMALNNWERFLAGLGEAEGHIQLLLSQPRRLEILLSVFAGSQFLSDTLIRHPEFFEWATMPECLHRPRDREEVEACFRELSESCPGREQWRGAMRIYKKRELLRLGIRDICLGVPILQIMQELSALAEALLAVSLERVWAGSEFPELAAEFCVLAFGKLGGRELNYSSDIDLLALSAGPGADPDRQQVFRRVMEALRADLSQHLEEGQVYRVDLRLRPFGRAGELVDTVAGAVRYYREQASLWELQALLKARPVAGNLALGESFLRQVSELFARPRSHRELAASLQRLRRLSQGRLGRGAAGGPNIKLGAGGIRDLEFLVQALQLLHAGPPHGAAGSAGRARAGLLSPGTLEALEALKEASLLPASLAEQLRHDYLFLRRVEHYLQIFEDRQTHTLPRDPDALQALARRMLGHETGPEQLMERVGRCMAEVEAAFTRYVLEEPPAVGREGAGREDPRSGAEGGRP